MCGGFVGDVIGKVTDAVGLTDTKKASKGYDAEAAERKAKDDAQKAANEVAAQRSKRKASEVLTTFAESEDRQKKTTLGG